MILHGYNFVENAKLGKVGIFLWHLDKMVLA